MDANSSLRRSDSILMSSCSTSPCRGSTASKRRANSGARSGLLVSSFSRSTKTPTTPGPHSMRAGFDADGDHLEGSKNYKLHIPKDVPVALFWSVTVYDPVTASGLDNGQPFPSINTMDKPAQNADDSTDIYFGRSRPARTRKRTGSRQSPTTGRARRQAR